MFVLLVGDFHIPHRAFDIHPKFRELLVPGKIQHVISTGNLTSRDTYDYLRHLASDVTVVKGEFDDNASFPDHKVVTVGNFNIGVVHGHAVVPWGTMRRLPPCSASSTSTSLSPATPTSMRPGSTRAPCSSTRARSPVRTRPSPTRSPPRLSS
ncbi:vacuolar protein sorting 29 isoform 2 [Thecamonas trahens ATCC 50062]|uniref:Vacuolar protein sorting-associated protein 29 n=1 Tax=Thecamonas trahens ATCC 50062 TaxID=461836 RepID=A0A0L0DDF2_THETB|nr:vacuolar protein sorting 29 isoform 2 [Thecamonas trahens ATCC 50062]KNC49353.1 vacuolar protein sorting 29 isoform 2 [Thecamonas trahens ATCC 50062]|eukprot:XP_013757779.1 vacuolar protein sorting 29 isoform 2 [Thecamonas trahens ATCC 50062]